MRIGLSLLFCLTLGVLAYSQTSGLSARDVDAYAVYAALLADLPEGSANKSFAIEPQTTPAMPDSPFGPQPCIVPPSQYDNRWTEVLADYRARVSTPVTLVRELNLSKPYFFLTQAETDAFRTTRRSAGFNVSLPTRGNSTAPTSPPATPPVNPPSMLDPKFEGVTHIFSLSDVYFSNDRTLALTGIRNWCGFLCASARWRIYSKTASGGWGLIRPDKDCYVMA